jgi:6-phosphogluconolactonase (cycloisomerase 2 family)
MKMGKWARLLLLAAAPTLVGFLTGCGDFWQAPGGGGSTSFTLTNSGAITVSTGATTGNTVTISVTPSNSFTGTVTLSCAVTTSPSGATSPTTCSLSPTSVTISSTTAQQSTLTAATTSSTTTGAYDITVTGVSGSVTETTTVCVEVGSGSCSSKGGTSGVFYVLNQTTDQVVAMSISSGQLTPIGAVTLPSPQPLAIAVAPNGLFLYVSTATGVYLYAIGSDGSLTLGNNGTAISTDPAYTMQVDATSSWLVETVSGVAQLNAVAINSSSGLLATAGESEQTVALPASTPTQLAISPSDSSSCTSCYVFVGMGASGTAVVPFNPGNASPFGTVSHVNVKNSGGDNAVAVDPSNRLLYVGESDALPSSTQSGGLRVFAIAGNGVTELTSAGSPYAVGGTGPSAILPTSDGNYVYVANGSVSGSSTGNIAGFSVSSTSLTSISTATAGASGHLSLAEDSTGSFLLAVDFAGSPDLEAYTMSSGTLTSVLTDSTGTDPVGAIAIAAAP